MTTERRDSIEKAYDEATAKARQDYYQALAQADQTYGKALVPIWTAYNKALAKARKARKRGHRQLFSRNLHRLFAMEEEVKCPRVPN